jgi:hypothetical protein
MGILLLGQRRSFNVGINGFSAIPNQDYIYKNFFKGLSTFSATGGYAFPANFDDNGYPTVGSVTTDITCTFRKPASYTGSWRLSWKGKAKFTLSPSQSPNSGFVIDSDPSGVATDGATTASFDGGGGPSVTTHVDLTFAGVGNNCQVIFRSGGNFTGFADFRFVRLDGAYSGDWAAVEGGVLEEQFNQDFLDELIALGVPTLRLMDMACANFCNVTRFDYECTVADMSYGSSFYKTGSWAGTAGGTDTYTCGAAPDTPGSYTDGEVVQVQFTNANTSTTPTLNVNSRGAKTIKSPVTGSYGALTVGNIAANAIWTLFYDALADCWVGTSGGFKNHAPLSVRVALCNKLGVNFWHNVSLVYDDVSVTGEIAYIAANLNSNLNCYVELSNEIWNAGFYQTKTAEARGTALGWTSSSNQNRFNYQALRYCQVMDLATAAWAPRSLSTLKRTLAFQGRGSRNDINVYLLTGTSLGAYGFDTAPNRPIDKCDVMSYGIYFSGSLIRNGGGDFTSGFTAGEILGLTTAASDYASGVPAQMSSALDWLDNDARAGLKNGSLSGGTLGFFDTVETDWNTDATTYGKPVELYEFGYEGKAQVDINTSNSYETVLSISEATATTLAANVATLIEAYKNDTRFKNLVEDMTRAFMAKSKSAGGCYYLFGGGSQWSILTGDLESASYKSRAAIIALNGG